MKAYQDIWIKDLESGKALKVCKKIVKDDTGGTDYLTTLLAHEIIRLSSTLSIIKTAVNRRKK